MKKKGFTIVEVIIAIAVFAIVTTSITLVINTSSNMYKQENVKFQTISAADSIIHQLKSRGAAEKTINSGGTISSLSNFFEYTVGNAASAMNDGSTITQVDSYIYFNYGDDLTNIPLNFNRYQEITVGSGNYNNCNSIKPNNKNFGALVSITRSNFQKYNSANSDLNAQWYYNVYKIDVTVWNLNEGEYSKAVATASISR